MKIILTEKFRRNLVITLNLIKYVTFITGILGTLLFAMCIDSEGAFGNFVMKAMIVSLGLVFFSMLDEIFVIGCLLKDNERIHTIFDFNFYGLKSIENYNDYKDYLEAQKEERREERARLARKRKNVRDNVVKVNFNDSHVTCGRKGAI